LEDDKLKDWGWIFCK